MAQERDIKYTNRTFDDFRQKLIDFTKTYFPDTYNDFSPTSPGMMFIEQVAYIGDVLSFYQDTQFQESFLQYSQEKSNLFNLSYMMGYRPKITTAATVEIDVYQRVDSVLTGTGERVPNFNQALTINENTQLKSTTGTPVRFFIDSKINFTASSSIDPTEVTVYSLSGNQVNEFLLKKKAKAYSAEIKTLQITVTDPEKFFTFNIEDSNIIGILDIVDSNTNLWYEVPYLAQSTIFNEQVNTGGDKAVAPYIMNLLQVPRRFVTRFTSTGVLQVQFGAGNTLQSDTVITPDPTNVGIGTNYGVSKIDIAYDPSNFMFTQAYGVAPSNTVLTIRYLVGGGVQANIPANTLTAVEVLSATAPDSSKLGTLAFNNPVAAVGGKDGDTLEEIRENALKAYPEQLRALTREDYIIRAISMPAKFGTVAKVHMLQDQLTNTKSTTDNIVDNNPLSLSMYILAYDQNRKLIPATSTIKANLTSYLSQYRMLTDAINIKDAFIVNIEVDYSIIVLPGFTGRDVLLRCTQALQTYFDITKWNINQPINLSDLYILIDKIKGVQTVQNITIKNKVGGNYSQYAYDIEGATKDNIIYPSYDPCIFEVKLPETDIKGKITTF